MLHTQQANIKKKYFFHQAQMSQPIKIGDKREKRVNETRD